MSQYRIKRIIGKISNIILALFFGSVLIFFLLGIGFSMIQMLCITLGVILFIFLAWASVNWGNL